MTTGRPRPPTRRAALRLALLPAAAALPACSAVDLLAPAPPQLYTLSPKTTFPDDAPRVDWQLLVETPIAPAAIDTARIVVARRPMAIDYFADVAWVDRAPQMVQTLLVESFESSRRITAIGREGLALRADYILRTELREFQAEFEPGSDLPFANVRMIARLVRMPEREIVAIESFQARERAASAAFASLIDAFDTALGAVLRRLVDWTLRSGRGTPRTGRS
jgi:cholesterol transport system auxiliary component